MPLRVLGLARTNLFCLMGNTECAVIFQHFLGQGFCGAQVAFSEHNPWVRGPRRPSLVLVVLLSPVGAARDRLQSSLKTISQKIADYVQDTGSTVVAKSVTDRHFFWRKLGPTTGAEACCQKN